MAKRKLAKQRFLDWYLADAAYRQSQGRNLTSLKGIGTKRAQALAELGIEQPGDALEHFPRSYDDRRRVTAVEALRPGETQVFQGRITARERDRWGQRRVVHCTVDDGTGQLQLVWFGQPYRYQQLVPGRHLKGTGDIQLTRGRLQVLHPAVVFKGDGEWDRFNRVLAVYPASEKTSQRLLRRVVRQSWRQLKPFLADPLTAARATGAQAVQLDAVKAWHDIHFPPAPEAAEAARRRLAHDALMFRQMPLLAEKQKRRRAEGVALTGDQRLRRALLESLPFDLTSEQKRVITEIDQDLAGPRPTHRLLQGDVGVGKTLVAIMALLQSIEAGFHALFLAPTTVLAEQHDRRLRSMFESLGVRIRLMTADTSPGDSQPLENTKRPSVWVGTHTLLSVADQITPVGLVIIDEQHRFGVRQRRALLESASGARPNLLVMTATPIPRSLALTAYGDLDLSVIKAGPPNRQPVETVWYRSNRRSEAYRRLARRVSSTGGRGFVICPALEGNDGLLGARPWFERLRREAPSLRWGLLHGRMASADQESVLSSVRAGQIDVLVCTTVVEVGIDLPKAVVMIIEQADRFGLSQLHQLRGRLGRRGEKGLCMLIANPTTEQAVQRLRAMTRIKDGFELARVDLNQRGPGELMGTVQHGMPDITPAELPQDLDLIEPARRAAKRLLGPRGSGS